MVKGTHVHDGKQAGRLPDSSDGCHASRSSKNVARQEQQ